MHFRIYKKPSQTSAPPILITYQPENPAGSPRHSTSGSPQKSSWHSLQVRPPNPGMHWHCPVNCGQKKDLAQAGCRAQASLHFLFQLPVRGSGTELLWLQRPPCPDQEEGLTLILGAKGPTPAPPNCSSATEVVKTQSALPFIYIFLHKSPTSLGPLRHTCRGEPFVPRVHQETRAPVTMLRMAVRSFQAVWLRRQPDSAARG